MNVYRVTKNYYDKNGNRLHSMPELFTSLRKAKKEVEFMVEMHSDGKETPKFTKTLSPITWVTHGHLTVDIDYDDGKAVSISIPMIVKVRVK